MKRGFTLIELLAVIVILSVIALIATPIVLNILDESKETINLGSAKIYLKAVEQAIMNKGVSAGSSYKPNLCIIRTDGNLLCDNKDILILDAEGEKPSDGRITFEDSKITDVSLSFDNKTILMNDKGELVSGGLLTNYIKNLYKENATTTVNGIEYSLDTEHLLMNDRLGNSEVAKTDGNIRYYGASPNNYIDIGDRDSDGNIIFWRIIGLFKDIEVTDEEGNVIKTEDLVKIVRADSIGEYSWDYTSTGEYDNNWNDSTLQLMLNDELNGYYGSGTTSYYNYKSDQDPALTTLDFTSTGLSNKVHNKIERVKWSLGGYSTAQIYTNEMYRYERAGTNTWSGKIALMYPSDYGYSVDLNSCQSNLYNYKSSTCKSTNWMYDSTKSQWTFIHNSLSTGNVFRVNSAGYVSTGSAYSAIGVHPVLYLNSDVGIVEEKTTSEGLKYFVVE